MARVLTVNSGSSSLKACLFDGDGGRRFFSYRGAGYRFDHACRALLADLGAVHPDVVGHRFVHGGDISEAARLLTDSELARLDGIIAMAPLHLPAQLAAARFFGGHFAVPQVACFDTAFHHSMPPLSRRLPIPQGLNIRRYGFHGLNYAHVARILPALLGSVAQGRVIVAHLGSGASLCLLDNLKSVDTTMGYTPAGGLVMATRPGDLDPGAVLAMARQVGIEALEQTLFHGMGLLALSDGESGDMQTLLASPSPQAAFAVDYFCQQVRAGIGALAAKAGGVEALVFTGGIGEHQPLVREKICAPLGFLQLQLDSEANGRNAQFINAEGAKPMAVVAADEESIIQELSLEIMARNGV